MKKEIDYTKRKDLPKCPECGRHGKLSVGNHKWPDIYCHKKKIALGVFWDAFDSCAIKHKER